MNNAPFFIGEDFSPWTEKARWALDHHGVDYVFKQYQPLIEEPWLRFKTRNLTGKATVPALIDHGDVLRDSFAIANWAERGGRRRSLFPEALAGEVAHWNDRSERALRAGRAVFFVRLSKDPAAQIDNLPAWVPGRVRPLLRPLALTGVSYLRAKHAVDAAALGRAEAELDSELAELRRRLECGERYLLGTFSYADIAMAVVLQFVRPVHDRYITLTPANRACWTHEPLAAAYQDIIEWRDELYAKHRRVPQISNAALESKSRSQPL